METNLGIKVVDVYACSDNGVMVTLTGNNKNYMLKLSEEEAIALVDMLTASIHKLQK